MMDAECVLDALTDMERHVELMAKARRSGEVVDVVRDFLACWPAERIAGVQKVDGGWAPFDESQRPCPVCSAADVHEIGKSLHCQCLALKATGVAVAPELLELDLFFFFAKLMLESVEPTLRGLQAARPRRQREARLAPQG
jgi:hypothetical protein